MLTLVPWLLSVSAVSVVVLLQLSLISLHLLSKRVNSIILFSDQVCFYLRYNVIWGSSTDFYRAYCQTKSHFYKLCNGKAVNQPGCYHKSGTIPKMLWYKLVSWGHKSIILNFLLTIISTFNTNVCTMYQLLWAFTSFVISVFQWINIESMKWKRTVTVNCNLYIFWISIRSGYPGMLETEVISFQATRSTYIIWQN